ncbi:MAG: benzoate/H(+) symporter BenE family transporter [Methylobacteriaceae bacterium]|nr:benzoate/H(+) symporter BenE family transporter [Methylobacteriaceae bacterium]
MRSGFTLETVSAGLLAAFVGFASSFPVVLKGLAAAGATPGQAASGLAALSAAMGVGAIWLSLKTRMPIFVAWSTPGAALLASTGALDGGFAAAVGAFLLTNALLALSGVWRPLGALVQRIPASLAGAMLAGILLILCLAPVKAAAMAPAVALPMIAAWAVTARFRRLMAVPAAVVAAAIGVAATAPQLPEAAALAPHLEWVWPTLTLPAVIGVALPLYLVTMASQNLPGLAVLKLNGYEPAPGPLLRVTGLIGAVAAPFGGHAVNLAAITAALCAGPDAHADPARRWGAAVVAGLASIGLAFVAGAATAFISVSPPILIEAVAGLALIPAFGAAMRAALAVEAEREAASVTFLVAASGVTIAGIGGAFWGLVAGGALLALARLRA